MRRLQLSTELKRIRVEANITVDEAAEALGCSTDKIHWMERGEWNNPKWRDVRDLLDRYGMQDKAVREELMTLAREGAMKDWWHPYRKMLSRDYTTYISFEGMAAELFAFELSLVPGLLQTEEYARFVVKEGPTPMSGEEIEQRVRVRMERQHVLTGEDPVALWAVIDEAALRRSVGGGEVMRAQMRHLIEVAELPRVTVQVIPFNAGPHPGTGGRFTILSFDGPAPDAAYVETIAGDLLLEEEPDVDQYKAVFRRLNAKAMSPEDTIAMIDQMMRT